MFPFKIMQIETNFYRAQVQKNANEKANQTEKKLIIKKMSNLNKSRLTDDLLNIDNKIKVSRIEKKTR